MNKTNIEYIEYSDKYETKVTQLLEELQDYIVSIDSFDRVIRAEAFGAYCTKKLLDKVKAKYGKIFLAIDEKKVIGIVVALILERTEEDDLQTKDQRYGEIEKLFILKEYRGKGIGSKLFELAENYLKNEEKCDFIEIVVFGDNYEVYELYKKKGYRPREHILLKRVN